MKKTFTFTFTKTILSFAFLALVLSGNVSYGQQAGTDSETGKHLVKWNVAALALKNYSFQYERAIGRKTSLALGLRFMPKSSMPFSTLLKNGIDDDQTWESIKDFKTGNFSITPEFRYYFGESVFQGFYVAPFVRYARYNADLPFNYEYQQNGTSIKGKMDFSGGVDTFTGGVLIGAQWSLSKSISLDLWIIGPNYGFASGNIAGKKTLNSMEQDELRKALNDDFSDLPLVKTKSTVDSNGAKIDFDGPWAGLRSGLSIGYRF